MWRDFDKQNSGYADFIADSLFTGLIFLGCIAFMSAILLVLA